MGYTNITGLNSCLILLLKDYKQHKQDFFVNTSMNMHPAVPVKYIKKSQKKRKVGAGKSTINHHLESPDFHIAHINPYSDPLGRCGKSLTSYIFASSWAISEVLCETLPLL